MTGGGGRGSRTLHRLFKGYQAETLRPPLAGDPLVVEVVEELEEGPSKFRTICSLLLGGRLNVTC